MKFWVVTPSYNQIDWLKICIQSVRLQTAGNISVHHHVQDGGSDDGSVEWLERYAQEVKNKQSAVSSDLRSPISDLCPAYTFSYSSERDAGMYDAINKGWLKSDEKVDVIAHLNCDEQYLPGAFEKVALFFLEHPDVDVAMANIIVVDEQGEYVCQRRPWMPWPVYVKIEIPGFTCCTFQRRSVVFNRKITFNTKWKALGDKQWFIDLMNAGVKFGQLNTYTSAYTYCPGNLNLGEYGRREKAIFNGALPTLLKLARPLIVKHNRLRFLFSMICGEKIGSYEILNKDSGEMVCHQITKPKWLWRAYHNLETGEVVGRK